MTSQRKNRELENLLRQRTEELNDANWRLEQATNAADASVVLILNQQLKDAREELARAKAKAGAPPAEAGPPAPAPATADDLTRLKGVGEKVAEQLVAAGVTRFEDVVALDLEAMKASQHPLHGLRARIAKDDWIGQAQALLSA